MFRSAKWNQVWECSHWVRPRCTLIGRREALWGVYWLIIRPLVVKWHGRCSYSRWVGVCWCSTTAAVSCALTETKVRTSLDLLYCVSFWMAHTVCCSGSMRIWTRLYSACGFYWALTRVVLNSACNAPANFTCACTFPLRRDISILMERVHQNYTH